MSKKINRYHREIFFPKDTEEMFKEYHDFIYREGPLSFSAHSVYKLVDYVDEFGKFFLRSVDKILKDGALDIANMFEFYADKDGIIQKACFRFVIPDLPVDIVMVIARTCVIVTMFTVDKKDTRQNFNRKLYTKKERTK